MLDLPVPRVTPGDVAAEKLVTALEVLDGRSAESVEGIAEAQAKAADAVARAGVADGKAAAADSKAQAADAKAVSAQDTADVADAKAVAAQGTADAVQADVSTRLSDEALNTTIDARTAVNDYSNDINKARRDVPVERWYRNSFGPLPTYVQPQDRVEMPKGDDTPPSTPTGVTAVQEGSGIRVAWQASTDDTAVTGYTVYRGTTSGFTPATGNAIGTGTTLNRLDTPGVGTWYYKVTARDAAGNVSAPSSAASATVAPPAEFIPSEVLSDWHTAVWAEQQTGSNGTVLATVTDGSGNGRTFSDYDTDTTRRPTLNTADAQLNGKKAIVFDGTNDVIKTDVFTAVGQPWSFAIIGYAANSGALAAFFDAENGTTSRGRHQRDTSNIHNIFAGASVAGKAAEKFLITGEFNGTTSKLMINGTEYTGSTGTVASITRLYLGARRDATWLAPLHLAFFGVVARSFTSGETASLKARTAQTYGVAIS